MKICSPRLWLFNEDVSAQFFYDLAPVGWPESIVLQ